MKYKTKIAVASLAFLPMICLIVVPMLIDKGLLSHYVGNPIFMGCELVQYPAISFTALIKTFHPGKLVYALVGFTALSVWSAFLAYLFWTVAGIFQSKDVPDLENGPQFD